MLGIDTDSEEYKAHQEIYLQFVDCKDEGSGTAQYQVE
jgi:hypothetical protein